MYTLAKEMEEKNEENFYYLHVSSDYVVWMQ